ncbi:helix-turn-helix transcriptional regulator [Tistlia consotensis]|uniref:helix-turn-helix transcriptional regulator n=1 Tax=Tistlia consotensis TaxID=1321365 RepID=UPI000A152AFA|nr:helix-turn-helix transcriptional regulator [Tistlia consotensis]
MESEYLTAKELATLLRIRERKVYELASSGELPCSRAMGKLLFPRRAVDAWLARKSSGQVAEPASVRPKVVLGSHDPLLEWALRESRSGLAAWFDGSQDGLERFARGEGLATGLHLPSADAAAEGDGWNVEAVRRRFAGEPVILMEWAWRERGLAVSPEIAERVHALSDLKGLRLAPRQTGAGSQTLLLQLLAREGLSLEALSPLPPMRTETEAVLAVYDGKADAAFGIAALARQFRLAFVPLVRERFDLLVDRWAWFEPPMQALLAFCRTEPFKARVAEYGGYDVSGLGTVHFNGAKATGFPA